MLFSLLLVAFPLLNAKYDIEDPTADHTAAGMLFDEEGDMEAAVFSFRAAAKFQPQDPEVWSNLAVALRDVEEGLLKEGVRSEELQKEIKEHEEKAALLEAAIDMEHEASQNNQEEGEAADGDIGKVDVWLDSSNFAELVESSPFVWMVEFGSGMCGSCKEFHPTWGKIVKENQNVRTGHVIIDNAGGMAVAQKWGVMAGGIPSVQLFGRKGMPPVRYESTNQFQISTRTSPTFLQPYVRRYQGRGHRHRCASRAALRITQGQKWLKTQAICRRKPRGALVDGAFTSLDVPPPRLAPHSTR
jgi:hypothetical protein